MPQSDQSARYPRLAGRHALVTGASQGIGRAIAIRFAEEGANVAINFVGASTGADETLALVRAASTRNGHDESQHLGVHADIGVEADIVAMFETLLKRWSRLDCLINNAGFQRESATEALDVETYRRIIEVNLNGAVLCAQQALCLLYTSDAADE